MRGKYWVGISQATDGNGRLPLPRTRYGPEGYTRTFGTARRAVPAVTRTFGTAQKAVPTVRGSLGKSGNLYQLPPVIQRGHTGGYLIPSVIQRDYTLDPE